VSRLSETFEALRAQNRAGFVAYVMAGDPDAETTLKVMHGLADAGADVIELGAPFTDPMADGPVIQAAALRALDGGMTLSGVLDLVGAFRQTNTDTPIVIMGYANPIHAMGYAGFAQAAGAVGADGAIVVDLPPEEDSELREGLAGHGVALIRLAAPTTDDMRLPRVVADTSGFVYYVSTTGVTGMKAGETAEVSSAVERVRRASGLPVAVGFGVKSPERAAEIARSADAVVVGSAIVERLHAEGADAAIGLARSLAEAARAAR